MHVAAAPHRGQTHQIPVWTAKRDRQAGGGHRKACRGSGGTQEQCLRAGRGTVPQAEDMARTGGSGWGHAASEGCHSKIIHVHAIHSGTSPGVESSLPKVTQEKNLPGRNADPSQSPKRVLDKVKKKVHLPSRTPVFRGVGMASSGTGGRAGSEKSSAGQQQAPTPTPQSVPTLPSPWIPGSQLLEPPCVSVPPDQRSSLGTGLTRFISAPHNFRSPATPVLGPVASLTSTEPCCPFSCPPSLCPSHRNEEQSKVPT